MPPVSAGLVGLAAVPLVLLLVTLVVLQWRAHEAASVGLFAAAIVAAVAYQMPLAERSVATAKGVWDAVFVLCVSCRNSHQILMMNHLSSSTDNDRL